MVGGSQSFNLFWLYHFVVFFAYAKGFLPRLITWPTYLG